MGEAACPESKVGGADGLTRRHYTGRASRFQLQSGYKKGAHFIFVEKVKMFGKTHFFCGIIHKRKGKKLEVYPGSLSPTDKNLCP